MSNVPGPRPDGASLESGDGGGWVSLAANLSPEAAQALQFMADDRAASVPETLRDVIAVAWAVHQHLEQGDRVLVERKRGETYELVFDFWLKRQAALARPLRRKRSWR